MAKGKKGRPSKEGGAALVQELLCDLIACKGLHVPAKSRKGYRNKMLYGLDACELSGLAAGEVNTVAGRVFEWVETRTAMPRFFWLDVSCKVTLNNTCLVKLAVDMRAGLETSCEEAWASEQSRFLEFLIEGCPNVTCVALHPSLREGAKPEKAEPMQTIYGEGFVLENTPNGVPFVLSPDTFCEVNHEMEAAVFETIDTWCGEAAQLCDSTPSLLVMGRNVNSLALGITASRGRFSRCISITHCKLAHGDLEVNRGRCGSKLSAEDNMLSLNKAEIGGCVMGAGGQGPVVVAVTAGRKGLHANTIKAFRENKRIVAVIYDACNHKTLITDMAAALCGPGGFAVQRLKTFDFFPGTDYEASVTLLTRCSGALVLPVGPAGIGKTKLARACRAAFPPGACTHIERDAIFSRERAQEGSSLMRAKRATHQALLEGLAASACQDTVTILDSTNGDAGARALYVETSQAAVVACVCFRAPEGGAEALVEGTERRVAAEEREGVVASFPVGRGAQIEKHAKILMGISYPTEEELAALGGVRRACVLEHTGDDADVVRRLFRLVWCGVDPTVFAAGVREGVAMSSTERSSAPSEDKR